MVQISKGVIIKVNGRLNYETKKKKKKARIHAYDVTKNLIDK